jgi:hypothetical protein
MASTKFPFNRLPNELKIKIIQDVISGYTLPEKIRGNGIVARAERKQVPSLLDSSVMIREIVNDMRRVMAISHDSRMLFTFDLIRDTLLVQHMQLPRFVVDGSDEMLPVRKIITKSTTPIIPTGVHPNAFRKYPVAHQLLF